jgi:hypothetical protein
MSPPADGEPDGARDGADAAPEAPVAGWNTGTGPVPQPAATSTPPRAASTAIRRAAATRGTSTGYGGYPAE